MYGGIYMLDHEKTVLNDFDKFLTECWKKQILDENDPLYSVVMKKKNNNDEETWLAIKMGLMMAYSRTQACYREQVLDRLI